LLSFVSNNIEHGEKVLKFKQEPEIKQRNTMVSFRAEPGG